MANFLRCVCLLYALVATNAFATDYQIDSAQTAVSFEVKLFGLLNTGGKFPHSTGMVNFDATTRQGNVVVSTTLAGVILDFQSMEKEVLGADFFDAAKFPTLDFKSSQWRFENEKLIALDGELTLHGVSKMVTLEVSDAHCPDIRVSSDGKNRCQALATVTVKRNDFGLKAWSDFLGDDVKISISLMALEQIELPKRTMPTINPAQ